MEVNYRTLFRLYKKKGGKIILTKTLFKFNEYYCNVNLKNRRKIYIGLNKLCRILDFWYYPFNKFSYYEFNRIRIIQDRTLFYSIEITTAESIFISFIFSRTVMSAVRNYKNFLTKMLKIG
jgi:hypothetical protein